MPTVTTQEWEAWLLARPDAHLLQTLPWAALKALVGWQADHLVTGAAGAQVLFRRLPLGLSIAYLPRGPVGEARADFWRELDDLCRRRRAIFLKLEPDTWNDEPPPPGFSLSRQSIQPPRTLLVDLGGSKEDVLARMKQKTRYNVRLAQKRGVTVQPSADLEGFQRLMLATGVRDGFGVHSLAYYRRAYELFHPSGACELLLAQVQGAPAAALMVFARGRRSWYLYGASSDELREHMPTYLLQWEAMRWAKAHGCDEYDLWGVPDAGEDELEANFTARSDGLWGVYRFKRGFGGRLARSGGPWDRVYSPLLYRLYLWWLARRGGEA